MRRMLSNTAQRGVWLTPPHCLSSASFIHSHILERYLSLIMKAVIIKEHGVAALADIKEQSMRPDYIKVKTVAVAINPTDLHHLSGAGRVGGILGCDLSGVVEEIGEECESQVKKGDAVYGVCHGANLVGLLLLFLNKH
jgi:hypothetical protein